MVCQDRTVMQCGLDSYDWYFHTQRKLYDHIGIASYVSRENALLRFEDSHSHHHHFMYQAQKHTHMYMVGVVCDTPRDWSLNNVSTQLKMSFTCAHAHTGQTHCLSHSLCLCVCLTLSVCVTASLTLYLSDSVSLSLSLTLLYVSLSLSHTHTHQPTCKGINSFARILLLPLQGPTHCL